MTDYLQNSRKNIQVDDLIESIRTTGLQTPIGVVRITDNSYGLVYGFRRYTALKSLGVTTVSANVLTGDQGTLLILNLQENVSRQDLTPIEESYAIQRILDAGKSIEEFRSAVGWSKTKITQRMGLLVMGGDITQALENDVITVNQARAIAPAPPTYHPQLIQAAVNGDSVKQLRGEVDDLLGLGIFDPEVVVAEEGDEVEDLLEEDVEETVDPELIGNVIKAALLDIGAKHIQESNEYYRYQLAIKATDFTALPVSTLSGLMGAFSALHENTDSWGEKEKRDESI